MAGTDRPRSLSFALLAALLLAATSLPRTASAAVPAAQGFGASTPGGSGQPVVHVTSLADSGPGTLRDALSRGNRTIVFDVGGPISLASVLDVNGAYVTIDGLSAPAPGITIRYAGLRLAGTAVHDVIVSGIRIRAPGVNSAEGDGITIRDGVYNVVIDHVSANNCSDGNIDITRGAHDITVQWSLLSNCAKNMLINYQAQRVSVHHNIWANAQWRNPNVQYTDGSTAVAPDITADFRNNIVWNWGDSGGGTILQCGAKANVVKNFYYSGAKTTARKKNAIVNDGCPAGASYPGPSFFTAGNVAGDTSFNVNSTGNVAVGYATAAVTTQDACTAAKGVLAGAGVSPRDSVDQKTLKSISLATCPTTGTAPTLTLSASPTAVAPGQSSTLSWTSTGATSCGASGAWSGTRAVSGSAAVAPTATSTYTLSCTGTGGSITTSTTVTVAPPPTLSFSASPASIASGQSSSLSWSTTNATACSASGAWSGSKGTSGLVSMSPTQTSTYALSCSGTGGAVSASKTVTVTPPAPIVSLGASPSSVSPGQTSTLTWSSSNATGCTASGGWSGTLSTAGSAGVAPGSTTSYGLSCTGSGGTTSTSTTITVATQLSKSASSYAGFGSSTPGGYGQPVVHVTTLADSGPGSLRDAVSQGNRYVVFDVAGTITLSSVVEIRGSYVTVNGLSAPSPGVTIQNAGLRIAYNNGTTPHDVIVSGLRIRTPGVNSTEGDGITIKDGVYNIVVDHVSADSCTDGNIDVTKNAHDVTVQWSVLSNCAKNMLVNYQAQHVSLHHNVWVDSQWRNPNIQYTDGSTDVAPDVTVDLRNNLIWNWGDNGGGTILQCGAKANVVANFYFSGATTASRRANAIVNDGCPSSSAYPGPSFYAAGNVSADNLSFDINTAGNVLTPFAAATIDTTDACTAAHDALAGAGVQPWDAVDQQHLGRISLPACSAQ